MTTTEVLRALVIALGSFMLGSINPAVLLARLLGSDVREAGSGNPGAANATRVLGLRWGAVVLVADVLKGLIPTALAAYFYGPELGALAGLAVILGHMFSPLLGFHGGKGVATSLGAMAALTPWVALAAAVFFGLSRFVVKPIGESSVTTALFVLALGLASWAGSPRLASPTLSLWLVVVALLVLSRHRRNIAVWLARKGWR